MNIDRLNGPKNPPPPSVTPPVVNLENNQGKRKTPSPAQDVDRRIQQKVQHVPLTALQLQQLQKQAQATFRSTPHPVPSQAVSVARTTLNIPAGHVSAIPKMQSSNMNIPVAPSPKPRNGHETWVNSKGDRYEGDWIDGTLKRGKFYLKRLNNECVYEGDLNEALKPHGFGKLSRDGNKSYFEGKFENGSFVQGIYQEGNYIYEGKFQNFKLNGFGTVTDRTTGIIIFTGEFVDGRLHGKGVAKEGSLTIEGDFKEGLADGQCVATSLVEQYGGTFLKGKVHGYATCVQLGQNYLREVGIDEEDTFVGFWNQGLPTTGKGFFANEIYKKIPQYGEIYENKMQSGVGLYHDITQSTVRFYGIIKDSKPYFGEYYSIRKVVEGRVYPADITIPKEKFLSYLKMYLKN